MRLERFHGLQDEAIARQVSAELQDLWKPAQVRRLSDTELLTALCEARPGTRYRVAVESELRRREAWAAPARIAMALAAAALLVAFAAFAVAWLGPEETISLLRRAAG